MAAWNRWWLSSWASDGRVLSASSPSSAAADLGEVGLGAPLCGERRGQRVEAAPQLQQVPGLGGVQRPHARVPVGVELDQALLLEPAQRLAQGSGADADRPGERGLREDGARGELAGQDERADPGVGEVALGREAGSPGGGRRARLSFRRARFWL